MNKEQMYELGNLLDIEIRKLLAAELKILLDNKMIKEQFCESVKLRIEKLNGEITWQEVK